MKFRELLEAKLEYYVMIDRKKNELYSNSGEVKKFDRDDIALNKAQKYQTFLYKTLAAAKEDLKMFEYPNMGIVAVELNKKPFTTAD